MAFRRRSAQRLLSLAAVALALSTLSLSFVPGPSARAAPGHRLAAAAADGHYEGVANPAAAAHSGPAASLLSLAAACALGLAVGVASVGAPAAYAKGQAQQGLGYRRPGADMITPRERAVIELQQGDKIVEEARIDKELKDKQPSREERIAQQKEKMKGLGETEEIPA